jgi:D-alanine-D-alanine ligase
VEEKFLAGAGQNVTPARLYPDNPTWNAVALEKVQKEVERLARETGIHGYARIDGFVRLLGEGAVEFWPLEINALPGLTPATVFFHQAGVAGYTPGEILEHIIEEGRRRPAGS